MLHLQGEHALHWPLVNAKGDLARRLAVQELQLKRVEDAHRFE
jgi:hypothetical protein